jgi:peptide/nickel transport system permease protein
MVTAIASLGMAIPTFITAIILLLTFGIWFPILPTRGYIPFSEDPLENLRLIAMPTMTLAFAAMAPILRMLRSSLGEAATSPWTRTAEGKGLLWPKIVRKHIFPNALIPTLTVIGITFGRMLGGVVLIEFIFAWPGIGTLMIDAIFKRDYMILQAAILFAAFATIIVNFLVDIAYGIVDPRLSFKNK